ncbi:SPX domain-containing protein 1-like [Zingiber officinale]|uniref:SPX domain-containing protein 1-like n=1 Tax=Zingiber officinale TaxID=94328 RepID=UPI001C4D9AEF|nr:SPX domain-containing protein 1-like [Zingiber officinale]
MAQEKFWMNSLEVPSMELGSASSDLVDCLIARSVRPKNICRLLNRQPQLPHRALTEKHPDASSANGEDDPLHFSVTLQQWFIILVVMNSGLVKILKKYDKRTGALIRQPFIEKVLQQPFFTTDLLYKLVKECVAMLDHLFPSNNLSISAECDGQNGVPKPAQSGGRVPELEEIKYMQSLYMKSTVATLRPLKQIRSKSSTVKTN